MGNCAIFQAMCIRLGSSKLGWRVARYLEVLEIFCQLGLVCVSSPGRLFVVDILATSGTGVVDGAWIQTFIGFLNMKEHNCLCKFGTS